MVRKSLRTFMGWLSSPFVFANSVWLLRFGGLLIGTCREVGHAL